MSLPGRNRRRWALRNAQGLYAHGAPWAVIWRRESTGCMAFERGIDARYLADRVLRTSAIIVLLEVTHGHS